ncbi:MAG: hypothetical protein WBI57_13720, partial [Desulfobacterales bacterium]
TTHHHNLQNRNLLTADTPQGMLRKVRDILQSQCVFFLHCPSIKSLAKNEGITISSIEKIKKEGKSPPF